MAIACPDWLCISLRYNCRKIIVGLPHSYAYLDPQIVPAMVPCSLHVVLALDEIWIYMGVNVMHGKFFTYTCKINVTFIIILNVCTIASNKFASHYKMFSDTLVLPDLPYNYSLHGEIRKSKE